MNSTPPARLALLALALAALTSPGTGRGQDRGGKFVKPPLPPQPSDVLLEDSCVHLDQVGGCLQTVLSAAGAPGGGFGVLWRDTRDANLGLYLQLLDSEGNRRGSDRPIHAHRTTRLFEPTLALARDGSGVVAWLQTRAAGCEVYARFFGEDAEFLRPGFGLESRQAGKRTERKGSAAEFDIATAAFPERGGVVAWRDGSLLKAQRFDRRYRAAAPIEILSGTEHPAAGEVGVLGFGRGRALLAWDSRSSIALRYWDGQHWSSISRQPGELLGLAPAEGGGAWLSTRVDGRSQAILLDAEELEPTTPARSWAPDGSSDHPTRAVAGGLAAVTSDGVPGSAAVLVGGAGTDRRFEYLPDEARPQAGAALASDGSRLLVAWTDWRERDTDVWARLIDPEAEAPLGTALRLNTDQASARQDHATLASDGEDGAVLWEDDRHGETRLYARFFTQDDGLAEEEHHLPTDGPPSWPAAALGSRGDLCVAWKEGGRSAARVLARVAGPDGSWKSAAIELDPGELCQPSDPPAVVAVSRGYVVVWCRRDGPLCSRRLDADGEPTEEAPEVLSGVRQTCSRPDVAVHGRGRLLVVWDATERRAKPTIHARLLGEDGAPKGKELDLPASPRGVGWDPSVAVAGGVTLVTWCDGPPQDRSRDVVALRLDRRGRAKGGVVPLTTRPLEKDFPEAAALSDGSFVVAWEDDLYGYDHTYLRRVHSDGELGPVHTLNQRGEVFAETRTRPLVAPLGKGLVGAWADRRRSLGFDVCLRILGSKFDKPRRR